MVKSNKKRFFLSHALQSERHVPRLVVNLLEGEKGKGLDGKFVRL